VSFTSPSSVQGATVPLTVTATDSLGAAGAADAVNVVVAAAAYVHRRQSGALVRQSVRRRQGGVLAPWRWH